LRRRLSRTLAVTVIALGATLVFALLVLLLIPALIGQATALAQEAPDLLRQLEEQLTLNFPALGEIEPFLERSLGDIGAFISERGGQLIGGVLVSARSLVGLFFFFLVVPVVAFYMLLDWDRMVAQIDALLPREHAPTMRRLSREVDETLSGFLRGQGTVMLIVGLYYAGALMIAGLNFGLVVGFLAGLVSFIPYVGAIVGGGLALGLALFQFWGEWGMIAAVAAIFLSGQVLEGNILTPKLVGSSVGLHPVWLLLALSAFGAAFGFVGLLAAVPLAAVLGVLVRFALERYRESTLYTGVGGAEPDPPAAVPAPAPPAADAAPVPRPAPEAPPAAHPPAARRAS
jgi:predicted PurR-regulated permease PerM